MEMSPDEEPLTQVHNVTRDKSATMVRCVVVVKAVEIILSIFPKDGGGGNVWRGGGS